MYSWHSAEVKAIIYLAIFAEKLVIFSDDLFIQDIKIVTDFIKF